MKTGLKFQQQSFLLIFHTNLQNLKPIFGVGYSLVGIASRGFGCGETLGVYTQVGNYAQWIKRAKSALENCEKSDSCFNQDKVDSGLKNQQKPNFKKFRRLRE